MDATLLILFSITVSIALVCHYVLKPVPFNQRKHYHHLLDWLHTACVMCACFFGLLLVLQLCGIFAHSTQR